MSASAATDTRRRPSAPDWLCGLPIGRWYRISGDNPDLNLPGTAKGTRYLQDGDPAIDERLNPSRSLEMKLRRLAGRYVKAPWSGHCDFRSITEAWNGAVFADQYGKSGAMILFGGGHDDYFGSDDDTCPLRTFLRPRTASTDRRPSSTRRIRSSTRPKPNPVPPSWGCCGPSRLACWGRFRATRSHRATTRGHGCGAPALACRSRR